MRGMGICTVVVVIVFASCAIAQIPGRPTHQPPSVPTVPVGPPKLKPIPTRQTAFAIPFTINPGEPPTEVQLLISTDQGKNWQVYDRRAPTAREFLFRGSRDGEYWFSVRTIDSAGAAHPSGDPKAELMVLLDTIQPKVDFHAVVGPSGEIATTWGIFDENLDAETFQIHFQAIVARSEPTPPWQQVAVEKPVGSSKKQTFNGKTTWWPKTTSQAVTVRAVVRDLAGNAAEVNRRVFLPRVASRGSGQPDLNSTTFVPPPNPFERRLSANNDSLPWHDQGKSGAATTVQPNPTPQISNNFANFRSEEEQGSQTTMQKKADDQIVRRRWKDRLPAGERLRMTNTTQFNLDYDVDAVGPSGVAKVELWATKDGGQTWENWGIDNDRQSPFTVEVDGEGLYGFSVSITSGLGFTSPPPNPGDLADIWVGVDLTKPTVQINAAPLGSGVNAGQVIIQWSATDQHFDERPISLFYSGPGGQKWIPIATDQPNTGTFNWRVDPSIGHEVHLLLQARDEANNISEHQLPQAINIEGLRPRGRIKGFQPAASQR